MFKERFNKKIFFDENDGDENLTLEEMTEKF